MRQVKRQILHFRALMEMCALNAMKQAYTRQVVSSTNQRLFVLPRAGNSLGGVYIHDVEEKYAKDLKFLIQPTYVLPHATITSIL